MLVCSGDTCIACKLCCRIGTGIYIPQTDGTIRVNKNNACLRKSSPLLCFFVIQTQLWKTQTQLWKTQTQLRKIRKQGCTAFQKLVRVRTYHSSEEAFWFAAQLYRKCISEKRSECWRHFFWRVPYCTIGPSCGRGRCGLIPRPSTPSIFSYVYCGQAYFERIIKYWWCRRPGNKAIIILNQSSSTSDMTTPILLYMGSVQLLPLNWIYSWCKVITRAILRLSKWYSLWTSMFCAGRGSSPPAPNPCAGSHEPLFWKSWL